MNAPSSAVDLAAKWQSDLASWAIPSAILEQAPESPWIHPTALFIAPTEIPMTPSHERAREVSPKSVLDVGCGGGIAAFALSDLVSTAAGVDHQQSMLDEFAARAEQLGLSHSEFLGDWPAVAAQSPTADVVTCHHVLFNVADPIPFLTALNDHASKRVVIEVPQRHPLSNNADLWRHFWQLERPTNPTSANLVALIEALGWEPKSEDWEAEVRSGLALEDEVKHTRIRLCLSADRDEEIREFLAARTAPAARRVTTIWWDK